MDARRESLFFSVPDFFFFEEAFKRSGHHVAAAKVNLDYSKTVKSNMMNCSPILNREQEFRLFRKYNYYKYRIVSAVAGRCWLSFYKDRDEMRRRVGIMNLDKLSSAEGFVRLSEEIRNVLVSSNMRLTIKPVLRYESSDSFRKDELISNAYMHIIKAIDKFDYNRGLKFSTYCVNAIKNNLFRDFSTENSKMSKYWCEMELEPAYRDQKRFSDYDEEFIRRAMVSLDDGERTVVDSFFGLGSEKKKLKDLALELGVSRATVGNIRDRALKSMSGVEYDPVF